jgi:S-adenosylmethionine:tRNA ribosyltransferase-isomerase
MRRSDFSYTLPPELIADRPLPERSASRLLELDGATGQTRHHVFRDLPGLLVPGDLLVVNDTRVLPARLYGTKASGGRVELLLERLTGPNRALVQLRASKTPKPGSWIDVEGDGALVVRGRDGPFFVVESPAEPIAGLFERAGHMPLPPYIERSDEAADRERYQTVYAREQGSVAAPTAGLHFDELLFEALAARGIRRTAVTLHVGAGTFQPVRSDDIRQHQMHREWLQVPAATIEAIRATRAAGGRVIAVGTTSCRALETAAASGVLTPFVGETQLFLTPGSRFRAIDGLITNFHLPESTLLMLVSAFAGREQVLAAYAEAIRERYRFFSYGDAMLVWPDPAALEPAA